MAGELDMSTVPDFRAAVEKALVDAPPRIVVDLSGVTFCDSQGLGTMVALSRKTRMADSVLVLTNPGEFLSRVLDITGLRSVLVLA